MNAALAGSIELDEPDWAELFAQPTGSNDVPLEIAQNDAFERIFVQYRTYHFTWTPDGKKRPMGATEASIRLAQLHIFPPRSLRKNIERDGKCFEDPIDDHCWLQIAGRAWRIESIEGQAGGRILFLNSFGEQMQIGPYSNDKWAKYTEKAVEAMRAAWPIKE